MKLFLYRLPFIALLLVIHTSLAQVIHPTPHILQVENYSFTGWPSNTTTEYPAAVLGWVGPKQVVLASGTASTTAQATGNSPLSPSNTSNFVVTGIFNEGSFGLSIQSTGTGNGPMAIVFALDTRNTSGITLTWAGGTWSKTTNGNPAGIQLQYRTGTTGNWTNVANHKVLSPDGFVESIPFSYTLPSSLENQPVVQFRWLYFSQVSEPVITARDGMQVDDIAVTATRQPFSIPDAGFSYAVSGKTVNFSDTSKNRPIAWNWDFGDGNTSSEQNPQNTYVNPGTYDVRLIAINPAGEDTIIQTVTILSMPEANFGYTGSSLTVNFKDSSTNAPTSWNWDFGDSNTSTDQDPVHTYAASGTYDVRLIASNSAGNDTITKPVTVTEVIMKPEADFDFTATALDVVFDDLSANSPTSWEWDFGDGNTSTDQNPGHTYAASGTYDVRLVAFNSAGNDTVIKPVTVTSSVIAPVADFSFTENNRVVDFQDESQNYPTSWEWDFGDGTTSALEDPQHTYNTDSTFNVCLIATNSAGSDTICYDVTVLMNGVVSIDHSSMLIYPNPSTGMISINLGTAFIGEADLKVINVLGKVVKVLTIKETSTQLDIQDIEPGAYMLVLDIDDQRFVSRLQILR